jgi:hypothetical protein
VSNSGVSGSGDGSCVALAMCSVSRRAESRLVAPVAPSFGHGLQHLPEGGQPVPRLGREVGAGEERLALGRQEDGHRPTALAGQCDGRVHINRVEVWALFAVDLDADEALVHLLCGAGVLEGLVFHHVAPVAGGVAD